MLYDYKEITEILKEHNCKIKSGYEIIQHDICNAVYNMIKKHNSCGWISTDYFPTPMVETDGCLWIENVYFNSRLSLIDADINFFEWLIEIYKIACVKYNLDYDVEELVKEDMTIEQFAECVNRKKKTVQNYYLQLPKLQQKNYYIFNGKKIINKYVLEELCKKKFKRTYLEYLEKLYLNFKNIVNSNGIEVDYDAYEGK